MKQNRNTFTRSDNLQALLSTVILLIFLIVYYRENKNLSPLSIIYAWYIIHTLRYLVAVIDILYRDRNDINEDNIYMEIYYDSSTIITHAIWYLLLIQIIRITKHQNHSFDIILMIISIIIIIIYIVYFGFRVSSKFGGPFIHHHINVGWICCSFIFHIMFAIVYYHWIRNIYQNEYSKATYCRLVIVLLLTIMSSIVEISQMSFYIFYDFYYVEHDDKESFNAECIKYVGNLSWLFVLILKLVIIYLLSMKNTNAQIIEDESSTNKVTMISSNLEQSIEEFSHSHLDTVEHGRDLQDDVPTNEMHQILTHKKQTRPLILNKSNYIRNTCERSDTAPSFNFSHNESHDHDIC